MLTVSTVLCAVVLFLLADTAGQHLFTVFLVQYIYVCFLLCYLEGELAGTFSANLAGRSILWSNRAPQKMAHPRPLHCLAMARKAPK